MNKRYEKPLTEVELFERKDVLTVSSGDGDQEGTGYRPWNDAWSEED